MKYKMMLKEVK